MATGGRIEIIFGPMFSSKTIKLIDAYNKFNDIGRNCLYINSSKDTRNKGVVSCNGSFEIKLPTNFNGTKVIDLKDANTLVEDYDVILIDEAQFFTDLLPTVRKWSEVYNKYIIIAGLIATSEREKFGQILDLFLYASEVTQTTASCIDCEREFAETRMIGKFPAPFTSTRNVKIDKEEIGSKEKYKATCQYHYLENLKTL